ncbi:MAG TPA: DUF3096 domain-containing protein [Egibacteraceae bacterium]|nr:DUF3096 domain-containing protein [Egibacteraceae bacterium]
MGPMIAQVEITQTNLLLAGILALAAGILILAVPRTLNYIVAAYLIIIGILNIVAAL